MKTAERFIEELDRRGETICAWADRFGIKRHVVFDLLRGRGKGRRGESHRAAVLMGMKKGIACPGATHQTPGAGESPRRVTP